MPVTNTAPGVVNAKQKDIYENALNTNVSGAYRISIPANMWVQEDANGLKKIHSCLENWPR